MNDVVPQMTLTTGSKVVAAVLVTALAAVLGYTVHEGGTVKQMAGENAQIQASLKGTNAEIGQLAARLNDLAALKPAPAVALVPRRAPRKQVATRVRMADGRWKKIQSRLDEQGNAIESTQKDLASTRTELQGSIARTHEELVVLRHKGERNYYEFDLDSAKQFLPEGPIGIRLRKANVKHQYADLELLVDDVSLTKKHVNLFEPAMFYANDSEHPVELIINRISKNHIHGYVSAPKYRRTELAAMSQSSPTTDGVVNSGSNAPKARDRLTIPQK